MVTRHYFTFTKRHFQRQLSFPISSLLFFTCALLYVRVQREEVGCAPVMRIPRRTPGEEGGGEEININLNSGTCGGGKMGKERRVFPGMCVT